MRQLTNFKITVQEDDFLLRLEADGETLEFASDPEPIEDIIDQLSDLLDEDADDEDGPTDGIYQKPLGERRRAAASGFGAARGARPPGGRGRSQTRQ